MRMDGWPMLSTVTFLPLVGALLVVIIRGDDGERRAVTSSMSRCGRRSSLSSCRSSSGRSSTRPIPASRWSSASEWLGGHDPYQMGVDGISMLFVILTTFLMPLCILASRLSVTRYFKEYMVAFLVLETLMIGVFTSLDLVLFYVFFEGGLIPMFLIIGIWGGAAPGLCQLQVLPLHAARLGADAARHHGDVLGGRHDRYPDAAQPQLPGGDADLAVDCFLRELCGQDADVAGAYLAAGRPCRGADGRFGDPRRHPAEDGRLRLPAFFAADVPARLGGFRAPIFTLSVVAVVYTSLVALMQDDMKKLIAYSSVAHMGFVTMGIFAMNAQGVQGGIFQMLSHGIVSGALFLCVGVIYDRMHTREIAAYGGLVNRMPLYAAAFMVFTLANVGLPGTSGFVGEFLTLIGTFQGEQLGRVPRDDRRHPVGGLCALALPAHHFRRAGEGRA